MSQRTIPAHDAVRALGAVLTELFPMALAFSGGLDSRFLAHAARLLSSGQGEPKIHLFHAVGPHISGAESAAARAWAETGGFGFTAVPINPLLLPEVRANTRERCYHCKRLLFTALALAAGGTFRGGRGTLCDGSNASDAALFRPGLKALRELGVRSPLAEAGLDKESIRAAAAASGMDAPDQRARPCMLTRFAYGLEADAAALAAVDRAERNIAALLHSAFPPPGPEFRLRLVGPLKTAGGALPYRTELHLSARPDKATARELQRAVAGQGFAAPRLVLSDAVSGHYDRPAPPPRGGAPA